MTTVQPAFKAGDRIIWRWPKTSDYDYNDHPIHTGTVLNTAEDGWLNVIEDKKWYDPTTWFLTPGWINTGRLNLCKHVVE